MKERETRQELWERVAITQVIATQILAALQECRLLAPENQAEAARLRAQAQCLRGETRLLQAILSPDPPDG